MSDTKTSTKASDKSSMEGGLRPSRIRAIVLAEHETLRKQLAEIDQLMTSRDISGLKRLVPVFQEAFKAHLIHEEAILWPLLATVDAWGPVRLQNMSAEHAQQRREVEVLSDLLNKLADPESLKSLRQFMDYLLRDMQGEEGEFLNAELMRDDVVSVGHFGG